MSSTVGEHTGAAFLPVSGRRRHFFLVNLSSLTARSCETGEAPSTAPGGRPILDLGNNDRRNPSAWRSASCNARNNGDGTGCPRDPFPITGFPSRSHSSRSSSTRSIAAA